MDAPGDWMNMDLWSECARMERPGYVFEIENAQGMTIQMHCAEAIPVPWDWTSPPQRFRLIVEPEAIRSDPIPPPAAQQ